MRRIALLAAVSVASLALAPAAGAAGGSTGQTGPAKVVNPGDPGSSQYQEDVPSAFGGVPAKNLSAHARHAHVPSVPSVVLPHTVVSTLAGDGSAGRAAAALAVAGTPTVAPPRTAPAHHHRARESAAPPPRPDRWSPPRGGPRPGTDRRRPQCTSSRGAGRSVTASVARSIFGSDGGLGGLLPVLLVVSAVFAADRHRPPARAEPLMEGAVSAAGRPRTLGIRLTLDPGSIVAWFLPVALVTYLGMRDGGFDAVIADQVAIAIWWALFLIVALRLARLRLTPRARVGLGLLVAYGAWNAVSLIWTESAERTMGDVTLMLLYVPLALLVAAIRGRDAVG